MEKLNQSLFESVDLQHFWGSGVSSLFNGPLPNQVTPVQHDHKHLPCSASLGKTAKVVAGAEL